MKHTSLLLAFVALTAWSPLRADDVASRWSDLCHVAAGRQLSVTTSDGKAVRGECASTSGEELSLTTSQGRVKIARSTITHVEFRRPGNRHHLTDLGNDLNGFFQFGFDLLRTPVAPLALVTLPATVAFGAVAAPFCAVADVVSEDGAVTHDVKITD